MIRVRCDRCGAVHDAREEHVCAKPAEKTINTPKTPTNKPQTTNTGREKATNTPPSEAKPGKRERDRSYQTRKRAADPEAYRAYQRELMWRRRASVTG